MENWGKNKRYSLGERVKLTSNRAEFKKVKTLKEADIIIEKNLLYFLNLIDTKKEIY